MKINAFGFAAALLLAVSPLAWGLDEVTILPPVLTNQIVKNPGKGWVVYSRNQPLSRFPQKALAMASVAVWRWAWAEIEPQENVFDWRQIDEALTQCSSYGLKCNFGIETANSTAPIGYVTPKWVFDAGALGVEIRKPRSPNNLAIATNQIVPQFDDPVFLAKYAAFLKALAARYDGNPNIAFIDIRSCGNWGGGQLAPWTSLVDMRDITPPKFRQHVQMHLDAFTRTPLCLPTGNNRFIDVYEWASVRGVWLRDDAVCGTSDGRGTRVALGRVPAVFEICGEYAQIKLSGLWDGKQITPGVGYAFASCVERGSPTYASLGLGSWDTPQLIDKEWPLVARMANRMGYYIVLRRAGVPTRLHPGQAARLQLRWENLGVAPVYTPCFMGIALLDSSGAPVQICWPAGSNPANWKPGVTVNEDVNFTFTVPEGPYRLALGLFEHVGDIRPSIRLGSDLEMANGWHVLQQVIVQSVE